METSEKTKKPGFSRMSVCPKPQVVRKRESHPDDLLYMKLMLGNRRSLWLPIGISPDLLKCYIDKLTEDL